MDSNQRLQDYRDGKLQFTMSDWSPDYADVHTYADPFGRTGGAAAKRVGYSNPEVDKLLEEGIAEQDVAARTEDYIKMQDILLGCGGLHRRFSAKLRRSRFGRRQGHCAAWRLHCSVALRDQGRDRP